MAQEDKDVIIYSDLVLIIILPHQDIYYKRDQKKKH